VKLEPVSCNLCGFDSYTCHLVREDLNLYIPGNFQLVRCDNCGLIYQNPRPSTDELMTLYPQEYDQHQDAVKEALSPIARFDRKYGLRKRSKAVRRHVERGRLLDLGCATGDFLEVMRDDGWEVVGIEPSPFASQWARDRLGLDVRTGTLETVALPDESFDVVTMWNVIEHLPDPQASLERIHRLLRTGGVLVLSTPNMDSVDARFFGPYWIGYELPRHLYVFSRRTLTEMIERTGYRVVETRCFYGSHAASMSSIRFWLRSRRMNGRFRETLEQVLFSRPLRLMTSPFFYATDRLQLSSPLTVICSKAS